MSKPPLPADPRFEPEFVEALRAVFEERIPFNRFLGLTVTDLGFKSIAARYAIRPELVGDFGRHVLHGGIVAAAMDSMAGLAVMIEVSRRTLQMPWRERLRQFQRMSTIDLRADYLEAARGAQFVVTAETLRLGKRVASVRVETFDEKDRRVATLTAAFNLSWHSTTAAGTAASQT